MTTRIATGTIERWIDGDTFVAGELDLGWGVALRSDPRRQTTHIRLAGVNAPDAHGAWVNPDVRAAGIAYVNEAYPAGTAIRLVGYELDDFGRSIATVYTDPDGVDVIADLLSRGYVRTGDYPEPDPED